MSTAIWIYLGVVNLTTFGMWGFDKWQARRGGRRVAEKTLLLAALLGGFPGAWVGVRVFRHKSSKRSFRWKLALVTVLNVAWIGIWIYAEYVRP